MSLTDNYIFDLDENVSRTSVSYKNRFGITIAADLYRPKDFDESREHAAVIVGAPYGGVKEQGPGIYAQNMALRGFVALTFDPSFNGYSGGEPRHLSSPDIFVEDFSAAVDYLGTRPFVSHDRIGVIGMCGTQTRVGLRPLLGEAATSHTARRRPLGQLDEFGLKPARPHKERELLPRRPRDQLLNLSQERVN